MSVKIAGQGAKTIANFVWQHNIANDGQRLGQRFVNIFISQPWPELFYEESEKEALRMINNWLTQNHYFDNLPIEAKKK